MPGIGFIKLMRSDKTVALMEAPNAFTMASVIEEMLHQDNRRPSLMSSCRADK